MRISLLASAGFMGLLVACSSEVSTTGSGSTSSGTGGSGTTTSSHGVTVAASTTGQGGAGGGIGQPSDVYPAPHPAPPTVVALGGPVLSKPVFVPVFFTGEDTNTKTELTNYLSSLGATDYWKQTVSEYGVGPATSLPPVVVNETPTGVIDDSAIQHWLATKLNSKDPAFPQPDANTIYALYYPKNVTITLPDGMGGTEQGCLQFGAYHNSVALDAAHGGMPVAYAVMPRCTGFGGFTGVDGLTAPTSHELIEGTTDPYPQSTPAFGQPDNEHFYWAYALGGGEVGDMCAQNPDAFQTFPGVDYISQRGWSNKSAKAGHNPCVPIPAGDVYFNAAPVFNDTITVGGMFKIKGVHIPVGQSGTVDVKLFSDGPTGGPFSVEALEPPQLGSHLDLNFDEYQGQNGQTLHLKIAVNSASQYGVELFMIRSTLGGGVTNSWVGIVGN